MTLTFRNFLHGGMVAENYNMRSEISGEAQTQGWGPEEEGETHAVWELGADRVGSPFSHGNYGLSRPGTNLSGCVRTTLNVSCESELVLQMTSILREILWF